MLQRLHGSFGRYSFQVTDLVVIPALRAEFDTLVIDGSVVYRGFGYYYLSTKALETFAPIVSWWAD